MRRWFTAGAEVLCAGYHAFAEEIMPEPVNVHSRSQWILFAGNPFREFVPAARLGRNLRIRPGHQRGQKLSWSRFPQVVRIAANSDMRIFRKVHILSGVYLREFRLHILR